MNNLRILPMLFRKLLLTTARKKYDILTLQIMYLISVYFDNKTSKTLQKYIDSIAATTSNKFMTANNVPPHLTICAVEAKSSEHLLPAFEKFTGQITSGKVPIVALGQFFPYVIYASPVLNNYLQDLSKKILDCVDELSDVAVSKFYTSGNWFPHITLGKTLTKEQLRIAFDTMQDLFQSLDAKVTEISLTQTNPQQEILRMKLKS